MNLLGLKILMLGASHMATPGYFGTVLHNQLADQGAIVHTVAVCGAFPGYWVSPIEGVCGSLEKIGNTPAEYKIGKSPKTKSYLEFVATESPDLVVLAGFMRILSEGFVRHYEGRLINIHPSLLPAFPGLHTHRRALDEGVRIHGCTVHFVTPALDHGPVIVQAAVPVLDGDDEASLAARVLAKEHQVYPLAVRWFVEGSLRLVDGRVLIDVPQDAAGTLIAPQLMQV